ncbi:lytic transglycosylase domain-containing protein [Marichromatium sp. AB32]|uniref:lytic transglycosylase domain-containing protein n=1 Tax=Marichromatium sp. AB32 TaxID=2483363 RepID=UPI000F3C6DB3|nr:lytic transglycosylase domain-containing protein [Marichromatium sp. AB32]RNE94612.1 LysM peptidoglycan-binding domain-containing protein [Marichromatium sp. AB32]
MRPDAARRCRPRWTLGALILALLALSGCATTGQHGHYGSETFPVPEEIADNVDFWRHVYGIWRRDQVVFHDDRHLGVIYEVATLPGASAESYTQAQRDWIAARKRHHADRVRALEAALREQRSLARADRQLLAQFEEAAGREAVFGADERVRSQRGLRERFKRGVEISGRYDQIFREIMQAHGVPEDLAYLPHVESSFQTHARSSVGAGGVWQFMPATGRLFMTVDRHVDERFDPILAADGAARYLAQAQRKLGSWPLAITSYNHGQGGMAKAKARYGDDIGRIVEEYDGRYFGFASRNFYAEFVAAREVAMHARRYFPEGLAYEQPWRHDRLVLRHSLPLTRLASHYTVSPSQLASLNLHWRKRLVSGSRPIPAGTTVWLPAGSLKRIASHPPAIPVVVSRTPPTPPRVASTQRAEPKPQTRYHVVQPNETLYRVALENGLTVSQLRALNQLAPDDNEIHPGQRLRIGGI